MESFEAPPKPLSTDMPGRRQLETWIDELMIAEGKKFLLETPRASHLTDGSQLDVNYYLRHRIETIWRIWLTARIDALALAHMVREDYEAARHWARYAADELDHDRMFLADLAAHDVSEQQVRRTTPFASTQTMVAEIEREMNSLGSLPALAYALFVEWNAERFSAKAVHKAEATFMDHRVAGAKRHVEFDTDERHLPMILDIVHRLLLKQDQGTVVLERLVLAIAAHFRSYFGELAAASNYAPPLFAAAKG